MRIKILSTFLDGRDRFEQGDVRTIPDADGARFVAAGWAQDLAGGVATGELATGDVSLDIQNSTHAATSTVTGG